MKGKKAQLEVLRNWFIGLAILFFIVTGYLAMSRPFQTLDHTMTPFINDSKFEGQKQTPTDVMQTIRKYWVAFPVVLVGGLLAWLFLISMKQDPNYPYM